jgi:hypothetical protein
VVMAAFAGHRNAKCGDKLLDSSMTFFQTNSTYGEGTVQHM